MAVENFGPTTTGFIRPTLAELVTQEQDAMRAGVPSLGFLAGSPELAIAEARAKIRNDDWASRECSFNAFDINNVNGCALDIAAGLQGYTRLTDETDDAFKARILGATGSGGFVTSLESAIRALDGVCRVTVFNNTTSITDLTTGNPAGSYEVVYQGGNPQQIAEQVWECSTGAINVGNDTVSFEDVNGYCRDVRLTRANDIPYCVRLTVDTYRTKTSCDNQTFQSIISAAFAALTDKSICIGDAIYAGRISAAIYSAVGGLDIRNIEFSPSSLDAAGACSCENVQEDDWVSGALSLPHRDTPVFDIDCIEIIARDR